VHRFSQAESAASISDGYLITKDDCQLGDVIEGRVKLYLLPKERNVALLESAAVGHACRTNFDGHYLRTLRDRGDPMEDDILNVEKARRAEIMANPQRWKKWTKLVFPDGVKLSNEVFTPNTTNGQVQPVPVPFRVPDQRVGNQAFALSVVQINWRVSIEGTSRPLEHHEQNDNLAAEAMMRMFAGAAV